MTLTEMLRAMTKDSIGHVAADFIEKQSAELEAARAEIELERTARQQTERLLHKQAEIITASQAENVRLRKLLSKCRDAFELTRQYVGYETLPAIQGWSWFDADLEAMQTLSTPSDTSALEVLVTKAGEKMRDRCTVAAIGEAVDAESTRSPADFAYNNALKHAFNAIRALPAVTLEDLK